MAKLRVDQDPRRFIGTVEELLSDIVAKRKRKRKEKKPIKPYFQAHINIGKLVRRLEQDKSLPEVIDGLLVKQDGGQYMEVAIVATHTPRGRVVITLDTGEQLSAYDKYWLSVDAPEDVIDLILQIVHN